MGLEIERKFLVFGESWKEGARGDLYRQGYLSTDPERSLRIRLEGSHAFLTIKGPSKGASRAEYEYAIPLADAVEILDHLCLKPIIEKVRYRLQFQGKTWEIDEFKGENSGLVLAEVELEQENEKISLPEWAGREVTHDARYFNASLVHRPFKTWAPTEKQDP